MMSSNVLRPREEPAVLGEELADVRVAAADPFADELVEVAHHLAVGGEVLGAHRTDRLGHAGHVLVEHLAAKPLHERPEPVARARLEEVVVLERAHPLPDVGGKAVELVEPARGDVAEHLAERGVRRVAIGPRGLVETPLDAGPLLRDDLVELTADVAEDVAEPVALEGRLAAALQALHQVAQAGHVGPRRIARPPAAFEEPAERLGHVALGHDVVGQGVHDLVGIEIGELLGAVPAGVAGAPGEPGRGVRVAQPAREVARVRRVRGHGRPLTGGTRCRRRCGPC